MFLSASDHTACSSCSCLNSSLFKRRLFWSQLIPTLIADVCLLFQHLISPLCYVLIPFFTYAGVTIGKLDSMKFNGLVQSEYFFILPPFENTVIHKTERFSFLSVITFMILSYFGSSVLIS